MKALLFGFCAVCLCVGLWNHDWIVIGASVLLAVSWRAIGNEVEYRRELERLWDDEDLSESA